MLISLTNREFKFISADKVNYPGFIDLKWNPFPKFKMQ